MNWRPSRAALIDFWVFDYEEFHFRDGKLLLRGGNGAGKSITMQSLLPVMLDGNVSSKRLDPFQSKDKHMDYYVLFESKMEERTERNSYILLEFEKPDQNRFITLGMGLNGKMGRNNGLDVFYFIVKDNRRYGHDFDVIRNRIALDGGEERITHSKSDLRKTLSNGVEHYDDKEAYAAEVNQLLFGFPTTDTFQNWIELLVQLRTPKLSNAKDMNFSAVYDILKLSMPALTDDDLRVLIESIQHMDNIQEEMETSTKLVQSLRNVADAYNGYNRAVLSEKSKQYIESFDRENETRRRLDRKKSEFEDLHLNKHKADMRVFDLNNEVRTLTAEKESYNDHEAVGLLDKANQIFHDLEAKKQKAIDKDKQYVKGLEKKKSYSAAMESVQLKLDEAANEMEDLFDNSEALAEMSTFYEHSYYVNQTPIDFLMWGNSVNAYRSKLTEVSEKYSNLKTKGERLQEILDERAECQQKVDGERGSIKQLKEELIMLQETFMQELATWNTNLKGLVLGDDDRRALFSFGSSVSEKAGFDQLKSFVTDKVRKVEKQNESKKTAIRHQMMECEEEQKRLAKELRAWKNASDPEPHRSPGTIAFRKSLFEAGVPHAPLYALIEWKEEVSYQTRLDLESALYATGILDALVAPSLERSDVTEDSILLGAQTITEQGTLHEYVRVSEHNSGISNDAIAKCLSSVSVIEGEEKHTVILSGKRYSMGALTGHAKTVTSCYVGKEAREKLRLETMAFLQTQIHDVEERYRSIQGKMEELKRGGQYLQEEERSLPVPTSIFKGMHMIDEHQKNLDQLQDRLDQNHQQHSTVYNKINEIRQDLSKMKLNVNSADECKRALDNLVKYVSVIHRTEVCMRDNEHLRAEMESAAARIIDSETDITELLMDKREAEEEVSVIVGTYDAIQKKISDTGADQLDVRIKEIVARLREISDTDKDEAMGAAHELKFELAQAEKKLQDEQDELTRRIFVTQQSERILRDELSLPFHETVQTDLLRFAKSARQLDSTSVNAYDELTSVLMKERVHDYHFEIKQVFEDENGLFAQRRVIDAANGIRRVSPDEAIAEISEKLEALQINLDAQQQKLFEDIILNTLGITIREKIRKANRWVEGINRVMKNRKASISFRMSWKGKKAVSTDEIDTSDLVELLAAKKELIKPIDLEKMAKHFRAQIDRAREKVERNPTKKLQEALRETLDYREWFDFKLECFKENKWHDVDRKFLNTASGGQRALSVYVPLFSALHACYEGANEDAARLVTLDEAFAGVDEANISDMFALTEEMGLSYIMTSQVLWGDYATVESLAIAHIIKPESANFATIVHFTWDGVERIPFIAANEDIGGADEQLTLAF
ncbi:MAG: hypothetical protein K0Q73_7125 [Paenibacillus sp.]|nr:hypothetical protein [Paenibacillus sp.]